MDPPASRPPSSTGLGDVVPALAALPVFPLPQTVLFPGALLPLHVFEPRYRAMVREALATHRVLSVALITGAGSPDARGHPPFARVAGVGVIVDHAELPSGRYDVVVRGRARVALDELPFVPPYRRAAATVLPSSGEASPTDVAALVSIATAFTALVQGRDPSFVFRLPREASSGLVADLCAHHLVLDARERQALLETLDLGERVRRVAQVLALQRLTLSSEQRDVN